MDKIIYPDEHEAFAKAMARCGESFVNLIETETGVKSAASNLISRSLLEEYRPKDSSKVLIHLIGMGNSDQYGFNRNGDYFAGDVLDKRAHTFVTHGHMFREHRNKDVKDSIGSIKYAAYDPKGMQRVEILVHMDRDKAPEEYEMAKKGSALNFSMSCRVPNDRCSVCGNEAKTISSYCDCLSHHMGQYMDGMEKYAFAYNDNPTFFDISRVKNPADRIARHLDYLFADPKDDLYKAASTMCKAASGDNPALVPGAVAAMAEGVNLNKFDLQETSMISKLASAEEYIAAQSTRDNFYKEARANAILGSFPFAMLEKLSSAELDAMRSVKPSTLFGELNKRACILSFPAFCQYLSGSVAAPETDLVKKAALLLPSVFGGMMRKVMTMTPITDNFCGASEFIRAQDPKREDLVQNFMDAAEEKFSTRPEAVRQRVITIMIRIKVPGSSVQEKIEKAANSAESVENAQALAEAYGQYQLKALCEQEDLQGSEFNKDYTTDLVAGANFVQVHDR